MPLQPAGCIFLEGHFAVLTVACLDEPLELLRLVGNVLADATAVDVIRDGDRL